MTSTPDSFPARPFRPIAPAARLGAVVGTPARTKQWLTLFVLANIAFAVGLYALGNTSLRLPFRIGVYAVSLAFLFLIRGRSRPHPAAIFVQLIAGVLAIALLNAERSSWLAGVAQVTLYLSVLAPLIWVGRMQVDRAAFERVALLIWAFYSVSAFVGALQVKYPGQFDGAVSINYDEQFIGAMTITTADGSRMMRPKGLTDTAGGAGASGMLSIILGFGVLLTRRNTLSQAAVVGTMVVGLFGVYLSHGRTSLVTVGIAAVTLLFILNRRKDHAKSVLLLSILAGVSLIGTSIAFTVGGESTVNRWYSLIEEDPSQVAYKNRGIFLEQMLTEDIYNYPLGAGTGRWGMMTKYFGDPATSLWAEMMWQALLYDGGIPLIILYALMLFVLMRTSLRVALRSADPTTGIWAGVVTSFTVATIAASFVYPVYIKAAGLEMILLNACVFSLYQFERARAGPMRRATRPTFDEDRPTAAESPAVARV